MKKKKPLSPIEAYGFPPRGIYSPISLKIGHQQDTPKGMNKIGKTIPAGSNPVDYNRALKDVKKESTVIVLSNGDIMYQIRKVDLDKLKRKEKN